MSQPCQHEGETAKTPQDAPLDCHTGETGSHMIDAEETRNRCGARWRMLLASPDCQDGRLGKADDSFGNRTEHGVRES